MTDRQITHATFTLDRTFAAAPAETFAAWSERDRKAAWFSPGNESYELDFRPGGQERLTAEVNGRAIGWESLYREIRPEQRIVYTSVLTEDGTVATASLTTVEFRPGAGAGSTELVLVEHGAYLDGREQPEWRERGTRDQLEALAARLNRE